MAFPWQCPYCGQWATITGQNAGVDRGRFHQENRHTVIVTETRLIACPNPDCREVDLAFALGKAKHQVCAANDPDYYDMGEKIRQWRLMPSSRAKPLPDYIPRAIVADYEEACAIETLSPKASATLARRCVQQILRDYFKVTPGRLYDELAQIQGAVSPEVWQAVDALRQVGNIGAHAEHDINLVVDVAQDEAADLIALIELLIEETYIARDRQQRRLADVQKLAAAKKALKSGATSAVAPPPPKGP